MVSPLILLLKYGNQAIKIITNMKKENVEKVQKSERLKPIFHQALFGRVGAGNATYFALGTLKLFFSPPEKINF